MFRLAKLGLQRFRSEDDYREMQRYIAEATVMELERRGVRLAGSRVLELGAGRGGYSTVLSAKAGEFLATDINVDEFFERNAIPFQKMDAQKSFPLAGGSFDLIYCSSLIEHLAEPEKLISECYRVLRSEGVLYLSFPPFYSMAMVGGHTFKPFHFLGERVAVSIYNRLHGTDIVDYASSYGSFGLYPLTIREVRQIMLAGGFVIENIYARMSRFNTARLPGILADLMTLHVCYLARKPNDDSAIG